MHYTVTIINSKANWLSNGASDNCELWFGSRYLPKAVIVNQAFGILMIYTFNSRELSSNCNGIAWLKFWRFNSNCI